MYGNAGDEMKINHVEYAVKDMDASICVFQEMGYAVCKKGIDEVRHVKVAVAELYPGLRAVEAIDALGKVLNGQLKWIRSQPVDALVGLIGKVVEKWQDQADKFLGAQGRGVRFLVSWCNLSHLTRIANDGLRGDWHYADGFLPMDDAGIPSGSMPWWRSVSL